MVFQIQETGIPGEVRLRHKSTGKCLYNYGDTVHNWVCWSDPNMVFVLDEY